MKYHVIIAVTITLLAIVVSASMVSAASDWNIPVSGPDGEIQVDMTTIKDLIPRLFR